MEILRWRKSMRCWYAGELVQPRPTAPALAVAAVGALRAQQRMAAQWRPAGADTRFLPGFKICARNLRESDCWDRLGNFLGVQHFYVQFGPLKSNGEPAEGTQGWGWAGSAIGERVFRPTWCCQLCRSSQRLRYGM